MKEFFHGCLCLEECPEGIVPRRFTPEQLAYWDSTGIVRSSRARSCAGVTIRMITQEPEISFSYQVLSHCKESMTFDLYENGHLSDSTTHLCAQGSGQVCFSSVYGTSPREVTIYLPYTAELALHHFHFGASAVAIAREQGGILWLGDSISQGMHAAHPSQTLTAILERHWRREIVNQGVGGCGVKDIPEDFTYGGWKPDILVMLLGTNDTGPALEDWEAYSQKLNKRIEQACLAFGAENIRLILPFWRADEVKPEIGEPLRKILNCLRQQAATRKIPMWDGWKLAPHCGDFYADQRLHPNDTGFTILAHALESMITPPNP